MTPESNDPIDFVYDELNRLTNKNFTNNTSRNISYTYDVGGRLLTANNSASQVSFSYDALSRVTSTTQTVNSNNYTLTYQYDDANNRTQMVYPSTKQLDYTYDADDNLTGIAKNSTSFLTYTYDVLGRRTQRSFINNNLPQADYTYDAANQLTQVSNVIINGSGVSQFDYTYDDEGNRATMTTTGGTVTYSYNDIYELAGVSGLQTHSYAYDAVGNRTTADLISYTDNNLNQYATVNSVSFSYDDNGNLTSDGSNTYTYDEENKLLTTMNSANSVSYQYDAFNRRVAKTINGTTTYYVYDADEVVAEYDSTNTLQSEYIYGDSIDEVLTMDRSLNTYYYHQDGLGSVTDVSLSSGSVSESYTYDPYGNITSSLSSIGNPYYFTGRRYDDDTAIYYYRSRYYDPAIGRFLQRDPLGYFDSMNLYSYALNNPINFVDPLGLCAEKNYTRFDFLRDASNFSAGFGDFVTFSGTYYLRDLMGGNASVDIFSGAYSAGSKSAIAAELALGAGVSKSLGKSGGSLFGKGGLLNSNRYLRVGFSRDGGTRVFRIAGDFVKKYVPKFLKTDEGHIILKSLGQLK